ncbi:arp2/3 complex-activating protein rickA isoform X2 [Gadus morhua]|uniref:arp2/3 complex-activating protein rickA isoform X2 n=1 Tax=Gadus morhua TaxID=8049 RepID=UPI0011B4902F|nr:arp2/3 complex-activating protein rickA-like isoform X2 [Gadus morhua]
MINRMMDPGLSSPLPPPRPLSSFPHPPLLPLSSSSTSSSPLPPPRPLSSSFPHPPLPLSSSSSTSPLPPPLPLSSSSSSSPLPPPLPLSSSSSPPLCPELDLSLPLSHWDPRTNRKVPQEPVLITVTKETTEPSNLLRNSHSHRKKTKSLSSTVHRHGRADKLEAGTPPSLSNEKPGCVNSLEGAEINTSLAFRAELLALQAAEFNSQKAVQETLQKSTRTKNTINSKVTQVWRSRKISWSTRLHVIGYGLPCLAVTMTTRVLPSLSSSPLTS